MLTVNSPFSSASISVLGISGEVISKIVCVSSCGADNRVTVLAG